ncbi:phage tail terminator-like protein [Caulobacter sp. BP25]|uniref:phage tail terminator-like protein n=1 Tax=Caulobacter sp. BP25 TaxID=2048900 RepID=UPI000C12C082|nr:phage tail terminator-like protein [Caulobacter sp. BP25]PHY18490.1 hypothetical protein CSW59_17310 [Caulobacter sp. BP25]
MSSVSIREALETAVAAMTPPLATAWENAAFSPTADTPYQRVAMAFAKPLNSEYGRGFQERGYMRIDLVYPGGQGVSAVAARADLIRATFFRGATFTANGFATTIAGTPAILPGVNDDQGDYVVQLRVPFIASITS